ncbi:MAG: retroviral-like aspartic protease family protein [Nitrospinota bacterium]|nr:retroviral-like aspartic protease family protein [Nitrospinota bacterium]
MARQAEKLTSPWALTMALTTLVAILFMSLGGRAIAQGDDSSSWVAKIKPRGWSFSATTTINEELRMELVIDSGSSFTIISTRAAKELGIEDRLAQAPRYPLNAGGGVVWVRLVVLDSVSVAGAVAHGVEGAVADLPSFKGAHGLLGKSYLDRFSFRVNGPARKMTLSSHKSRPLYGGRGEGWWKSQAKRLRLQERLFRSMELGAEKSVHSGDTPDRLLSEKLSRTDAARLARYFKDLLTSLEKEARSLGAPEEWAIQSDR